MKAKLNKKQLIREAEQQKNALKQLTRWMKYAMIFSSCAMVLTWWGLTGAGVRLALGIAGVVLTIVGILCAALIGLGVRNGRRNVEHILQAAQTQ
ncbi:MAG: hypothetical protein ACI3XW_02505 [Butyricicoccus sp.]|nr:hypothetical protein [Clostridiales bacterium]